MPTRWFGAVVVSSPVYTATFKTPLPAGIHVEVVTDSQGSVLIASADGATKTDAQALLAAGFNAVSQAWQAASA